MSINPTNGEYNKSEDISPVLFEVMKEQSRKVPNEILAVKDYPKVLKELGVDLL